MDSLISTHLANLAVAYFGSGSVSQFHVQLLGKDLVAAGSNRIHTNGIFSAERWQQLSSMPCHFYEHNSVAHNPIDG
jgi:hypothetical protein